MENVSSLAEFFQHMHQVEDQCDLQLVVDPGLESALAERALLQEAQKGTAVSQMFS